MIVGTIVITYFAFYSFNIYRKRVADGKIFGH